MLLLLSLILFVGCSNAELNHQSQPFNIENDNLSLEIINYGPTNELASGFKDKTQDYGLENVKADNFNLIDLNADGHTDIILIEEYISSPIVYLYNKNTKKFEKQDYSPFPVGTKASHIYFYDINKDNILDAIVCVFNRKSELKEMPIRLFTGYLTSGKIYFKDSQQVIGKKNSFSSSLSLIDYDLDGDLDIFVSNWFSQLDSKPIPEHDLFIENINGNFKDKTDILNEETLKSFEKAYINAKPTFASSTCDIDQNGFPDILTASTNGYSNKLWMNLYKSISMERQFKDVGIISNYSGDSEGYLTSTGGGRTFTTSCADYNNDGIMDIFLGELHHNYDSELSDKSSILTGKSLNFPPNFIRTEYFLDNEDIEWHQSDRRGVWFDYNNDGLIDLLVDNTGYPPHSRLILFKQLSDHSFVNVAKEVGINIVNPQSSVIGDFNQDGKMDIITSQNDMRDQSIKKRIYLFENQVDDIDKQTLRIFLHGQKSNKMGLGATVILKIKKGKETIYRRQYVEYSQGGLAPQNEEGLHFAMSQNEKLKSIKVIWPYSENLNTSRSNLEKNYKLKDIFKKRRIITLCENGNYFEQKSNCN